MRYIGGSDIAAIVGYNPFKNITDIYYDKTNKMQGKTNKAIQLGENLEEHLVNIAAARLGDEPIHNLVFTNEWRRAQVDAWLPNRQEVLEAKVVGIFNPRFKPSEWGPEDTTQVPPYYYLQVMWQIYLSNAKGGNLVALIGSGIGYRLYTIPRDDDLISELERHASDFWNNHVLLGVPPSQPASLDTYKSLPRERLKRVEIDTSLVDDYLQVMEAAAEIDRRKDEVKALILQSMGDAEVGYSESGDFYYKADKNGKRTLRYYPPREDAQEVS
jgi:putative phage-type endonuclease